MTAGSARVSGPALTPEQRSRLIEVLPGGVPLLRKSKGAPRTAHLGLLEAGRLVRREDGSVWRVERVRPTAADVRCVRGRKVGDLEAVSPSAAGCRYTTEEDLEAERAAAVLSRALAHDETRCSNCWPRDPEVRDLCDNVVKKTDGDYQELWALRGRDPNCADHRPSAASLERAERGAQKRKREEKPEDVARVLELRAAGLPFHKIEEQMGWPGRGGRSYKIVKAAASKEGK